MAEYDYDVVLVGAGITSGLMAYQLATAGHRVLVLEAGPSPLDLQSAIDKFYAAWDKDPGSPWPDSPFAPKPRSPGNDWRNPDDNYLVQTGSVAFGSTYERTLGGTTRHWLGTALRMVPASFKMKSTYDRLRDWPIAYADLEAWYTQAENMIGVAGDLENDHYLHVPHSSGYPMQPVPVSYLDQQVGAKLNGFEVTIGPRKTALQVISTPQARNTAGYNNRPPCMGNTNCVPICPISAKYDATVHLKLAQAASTPAVIQDRSIVHRVEIDPATDQVSRLHYKRWSRDGSIEDQTVTARRYVLAAHAIETPKILLMSPWKTLPDGTRVTAANSSGQVGKNLMDNICNVSWGLTPEPVYPYRGPLSTSGIPAFRDGEARRERAAFRIEVGNDGWVWPTGAPQTTVTALASGQGAALGYPEPLWGTALKQAVHDVVTRQLRFALEMEAVPLQSSYVRPSELVDPKTGIPRPEVHYEIYDENEPDGTYCVDGYAETVEVANQIFDQLGAQQMTEVSSDPSTPGWFSYRGKEYQFRGAGHVFGTYRMGEKADSVVDREQRSWDHENLFLVGCGVFPTTGTANPTLTASALALWAAKTIDGDLKNGGAS